LSIIDLCSMTIGNCIGVIAAFNNFDYWALIIAIIVTFCSRVLLTWCVVGWTPSLFKKNSGAKPLLSFGANLTGANFVGFFTNNVTPFSIGIFGGAGLLGLYDRSFRLASIPKNQVLMPIMKVLQSTLVRVAHDKDRLKNLTISLMSKIAIVTFLISLIMYLSADWIILLLLGDSWKEAVPFFEILAIATIATPITTLTAMTLVAVGEANALFKWKIITLVILIVAIGIGSNWGVLGILWGAALSALLVRTPLFFIYSEKYLSVKAWEFAKVILPPLVISLLIVLFIKYLSIYYLPDDLFSAITLYWVLVPIFYVSLCFIFKSTRCEINAMLDLIKHNLNISKIKFK
jgi:O-antigen/teichoic acid export membrane protein